MNINDFTSLVNSTFGFARPTRYRVDIGLQKLLSVDSLSTWFDNAGITDVRTADRLAFFCSRASLPAKVFNTSEVRTYGPTYKLPFQGQYPDVVFEFYVGQDMLEAKFFNAWMYGIEDPETMNINYLDDFSTNVVISQMSEFSNEAEQSSHQILLLNAWPIAVNQMELSYDAVNAFHKIQVSFAYKRWLSGDAGVQIAASVIPRGTVQSFNNFIGVK